ncbi:MULTISPECIES: phage tail terminator-like protein [unclassified Brevundimonas]|uniref:phage tail terminator-like protein n=1 Tax=unclassified Brevundimonas TaxID=2622653 RepID=UPI0025BFFD74|nr:MULTISPECIES: phage tail terminator-like protein [unclassified Brevundimonas]
MQKVTDALLSRVGSLVLSPALPVAYPGLSFTPPAGGKYLTAEVFYNAPRWEGATSGRMDQGLLQITVVWPKGVATIQPITVADAVRSHFAKGTELFSNGRKVTVSQEPRIATPLIEDSRTLVPVTIPWVSA